MAKGKKTATKSTEKGSPMDLHCQLQATIAAGNSRIEAAKGKERHKIVQQEVKKRQALHAALLKAS